MINFPPINSPTHTRGRAKNKQLTYAKKTERERQKPISSERRGHGNRRRTAQGTLIINRRLSTDRRKGRINLIV